MPLNLQCSRKSIALLSNRHGKPVRAFDPGFYRKHSASRLHCRYEIWPTRAIGWCVVLEVNRCLGMGGLHNAQYRRENHDCH